MRPLSLLAACVLISACDDIFAPDATREYIDVATGAEHTCAIAADGAAYCWGRNSDGQLGNGTTADSFRPILVLGNLVFKEITAGDGHTCALTTDGQAYCWGFTAFYQIGNPFAETNTEPVPVTTQVRFTQISAGAHHTCALSTDSRVYCWGYNRFRQTGFSQDDRISQPFRPVFDFPAVQVTSGALHTCALTASGGAFCWGSNQHGQLGIGSDILMTSEPTQVDTNIGFVKIDAGRTHTCAVAVGGLGYCWGSAEIGQLGDQGLWRADLPGAFSPSEVFALENIVDIDAGTNHTCAIDGEGRTWCWGRGTYGQLANGATAIVTVRQPVHFSPTHLHHNDLLQFDQLGFGGATHACALGEGRVWCWGTGPRGQLGLEQYMLITVPQRVPD